MNLLQRLSSLLVHTINAYRDPAAIINGAGEPSFTLKGDDPLASALVREWAQRAERGGVNQPKILRALGVANRMDHMDPAASFTLRGQDAIATGIVQMWIQRAQARHLDAGVIADAQATADAMSVYAPKKIPD